MVGVNLDVFMFYYIIFVVEDAKLAHSTFFII
jgi:hypothetical protein